MKGRLEREAWRQEYEVKSSASSGHEEKGTTGQIFLRQKLTSLDVVGGEKESYKGEVEPVFVVEEKLQS